MLDKFFFTFNLVIPLCEYEELANMILIYGENAIKIKEYRTERYSKEAIFDIWNRRIKTLKTFIEFKLLRIQS